MKNKHKSLDDYLKKLEKEAANELQEFLDLSPSYYSTEHLLELRRKWLGEMQLFLQMKKVNYLIGALTPFWLTMSIAFYSFNIEILTVIAACLFVVFLLAFLTGLFFIKQRFKSRAYQEYIGNLLNNELQLRGIHIQLFDYKRKG